MLKYIVAILSIMLGSTAQYLFKIGLKNIQDGYSIAIIKSPAIWGGLICYGVSLLLWFYVLSKMELSRAYPIVSIGYIFTLFFGYFLLNEPLSVGKIVGIVLIVLGVFVLTRY